MDAAAGGYGAKRASSTVMQMQTLLASLLRRRKRRPAAAPDVDTLRRDLSLAVEHLTSIHCLLEIAREYQQPIPTAALKNLELVSKNLGDVLRQISAMACRPEPPPPPRPRLLSGECHTSPSGI